MITKQQALEFIYELSKEHDISLDVPHGYMEIDSETDIDRQNTNLDFNFSVKTKDKSLEKILTIFIQTNLQTNLFKQLGFPIPVDVDMLEVGQTYKVELDDFYDGCHSVHIAKYMGKKEEYYYFENRHTWRYEKKDLYQLWKMNKKESEER